MSRTMRNAEDWRRVVFRIAIKPSIKVGMIYLADWMTTDRRVSRPRHLMARDLGVSERTVDKMISGGHDAGLLSTITKGHNGTTATYQGLFPGRRKQLLQSPTKGEHSVRATGDVKGEPRVRAIDSQSVRATRGNSANTGFAPIDTHRSPEPDGCETCGDAGCSECVS